MRELLARLLQGLLTATLVVGAVGVVRQRTEAVAVRRGTLTPASATADIPPRRPEGALGAQLGSWVPTAPTTSAGRIAAAVWAGPLTLVGSLLALLGGGRPRWDDELGCFVARGVGGVSAAALRSVGADANTIGQVVLSRQDEPPASLLAHESVHVRQTERLGPTMIVAYAWLAAAYGYRDHPFERAARLGARQVAQRSSAASSASEPDPPASAPGR